jgi:hypothetical protein
MVYFMPLLAERRQLFQAFGRRYVVALLQSDKEKARIARAFILLSKDLLLKRNPCTSPKTAPASTTHPF